MSKNKTRLDVQVEKVSVFKTLNVFQGIRLPWLMIIGALVTAMIHAYVSFEVVTFSANVIDSSGNLPTKHLVDYIISGCIVGTMMIITSLLQNWATQKINHDMRIKLWNKIMGLRYSDLGSDSAEQLVSRVTVDCNSASAYFTTAIQILAKLVTLVVYTVGMFQYNTTMAGFAMTYIPVSIILGYVITIVQYIVNLKKQAFLAMETGYLVERTKDLALIKTCNSQEKEIETGNAYFDAQYKNQVHSGYITMFAEVVNKVLELLSTILPFVIGGMLYARGEMSLGVVVVFSTLIAETKNCFTNLITYFSTMKAANGAVARISKIFRLNDEDITAGEIAPEGVEDIQFEDVRFAYTEGKNTLKNISLKIPKNQITAVIGKNGSGKTTMFKLLDRLYEPTAGTIRFGDESIADYSLESWRNKICYVAQGGALMTGTLRSNICYGMENVSEEDFDRAVRLSHVHDFAKDLPEGYDAPVTADGMNFSGGQRQCIAIARAILSKKPYLLLDEATSNLDAKREHDVMDAMHNLTEGRTTVIIAHSLNTIKRANYVIVLNNGEVEAAGAPSVILTKTDNYLSKMMDRTSV